MSKNEVLGFFANGRGGAVKSTVLMFFVAIIVTSAVFDGLGPPKKSLSVLTLRKHFAIDDGSTGVGASISTPKIAFILSSSAPSSSNASDAGSVNF